jgi:hypothetical protein
MLVTGGRLVYLIISLYFYRAAFHHANSEIPLYQNLILASTGGLQKGSYQLSALSSQQKIRDI